MTQAATTEMNGLNYLLQRPDLSSGFFHTLSRSGLSADDAMIVSKLTPQQIETLMTTLAKEEAMTSLVERFKETGQIELWDSKTQELESVVKKQLNDWALGIGVVAAAATVVLAFIALLFAVLAVSPLHLATAGITAAASAAIAAIFGFLAGVVAAVGGIVVAILAYVASTISPTLVAVGTKLMGGTGGTPFIDDLSNDATLVGVSLWHEGGVIHGLQNHVFLRSGSSNFDGPVRGSTRGEKVFVDLSLGNLVGVSGRANHVVTQLKFHLDDRPAKGPFPVNADGEDFALNAPRGARINGFFGRSAGSLDAIGILHDGYLDKQYGGGWAEGAVFLDDRAVHAKQIREIRVSYGQYIDSIQTVWQTQDGTEAIGVRHGGTGGHTKMAFALEEGETITEIGGRAAGAVDQLWFKTSRDRRSPVYGGGGGAPFLIKIPQGKTAIGFYGRAAGVLYGLGVYTR